jgi:glycosyltransferase involved in cell wall biosynthesis
MVRSTHPISRNALRSGLREFDDNRRIIVTKGTLHCEEPVCRRVESLVDAGRKSTVAHIPTERHPQNLITGACDTRVLLNCGNELGFRDMSPKLVSIRLPHGMMTARIGGVLVNIGGIHWHGRAPMVSFSTYSGHGQPRICRNDYGTLSVPVLGCWSPVRTVSVVVPAHGCQDKLDLTLASLAAQSYPAHLVQAVVVDDGSTPPLRLPEIVPEHTVLVRSPTDGWGAGHALDTGIRVADGAVVHRLDADMLIYREHLEATMRWHHLADYLVVIGSKRFVDFVAGSHQPRAVHDAVARGDAESLFDVEASQPSWVETVIDETDRLRVGERRAYVVGTGPTISLTRDLYDQCGGVDVTMIRGQDIELSYRLAQVGAVFVPEPQARAYHLGRTEMMSRNADGTRFRTPYFSNRLPVRRTWRTEVGRQWLVPYVEVIVDVGALTRPDPPVRGSTGTSALGYESVRATVTSALCGTTTDVRVTLVGPWSKLTDHRRAPLDDPRLDLRLLRECFAHDARVCFVESVPAISAPVPFRFHLPLGWELPPDALRRLIATADAHRCGMVVLTLPRTVDPTGARLERTAALARAHRLRRDGEDLTRVVEETYGLHCLNGTDWALVPSGSTPHASSPSARKITSPAAPGSTAEEGVGKGRGASMRNRRWWPLARAVYRAVKPLARLRHLPRSVARLLVPPVHRVSRTSSHKPATPAAPRKATTAGSASASHGPGRGSW